MRRHILTKEFEAFDRIKELVIKNVLVHYPDGYAKVVYNDLINLEAFLIDAERAIDERDWG